MEDVAVRTAILPDHQREEIRSAIALARLIDEEAVEQCSLEHEREWMREVNEVVLRVLIKGKLSRELSVNSDYLWTEGRHLMRQSSEALHDPKPDFAFGLRSTDAVTEVNSSHLSTSILNRLQDSARVRLTYSPSQRRDIVYPAIIYEGKSDTNPIVWAENQVAVGAARALGILQELSDLSGIPTHHVVIAIASSGSEWRFYVCSKVNDDAIVSIVYGI